MCSFHFPFFYVELVRQLHSVERSTKEDQKDEQGWFNTLRIVVSIRISIAVFVSKEV